MRWEVIHALTSQEPLPQFFVEEIFRVSDLTVRKLALSILNDLDNPIEGPRAIKEMRDRLDFLAQTDIY